MDAIRRTLRSLTQLASTQRKLWFPFLVSTVTEIGLIGLIWLAPQPPFSDVLAPPIRYFFGERVLHYPWHLWFMYHAMKHTNLLASILVGAFMSGLACLMVRQSCEGRVGSLRDALISRQVRYGTVALIWMMTWLAARGTMELLGRFSPRTWTTFGIGLGVAVLLQALLVYAIPVSVYEDLSWWRAMGRSIRETIRYPLSTLAMVVVPSGLVIAFSLLAPSARVARWMMRSAPELVLLVILARLAIWLVADTLLTVGIAQLWCAHHGVEALAAARSGEVVPPLPRGAGA